MCWVCLLAQARYVNVTHLLMSNQPPQTPQSQKLFPPKPVLNYNASRRSCAHFVKQEKPHVHCVPPHTFIVSDTTPFNRQCSRATRSGWHHRGRHDRRQHQPPYNQAGYKTRYQTGDDNNHHKTETQTNYASRQTPDIDNIHSRLLLPTGRVALYYAEVSRSTRSIFKGHGAQSVDDRRAL